MTPGTVAYQAPLSIEFSRQEHEWVAISFSNNVLESLTNYSLAGLSHNHIRQLTIIELRMFELDYVYQNREIIHYFIISSC